MVLFYLRWLTCISIVPSSGEVGRSAPGITPTSVLPSKKQIIVGDITTDVSYLARLVSP